MATVFVWPALGTTVTLEDLTVITSAGASVTYTAEIRQNIASGFLLTYDPTGGGVDPDPATSISTIYATTVAALSTIRGNADTQLAFVECHTTRGDGGGGWFVWDSDETATANSGTILGTGTGRWMRVYSGAINMAWFGTVTAAKINAAIAIQNALGGGEIFVPKGAYAITGVGSDRILPLSNTKLVFAPGCTISMGTQSLTHVAIQIEPSTVNKHHIQVIGNGCTITGARAATGIGWGFQIGAVNATYSAEDVLIDGFVVENMKYDGVYVGGNVGTVTDDIVIRDVTTYGCVRNGLAIAGTVGNVLVEDCDFSDTSTPSTFSIQAGVDIEVDDADGFQKITDIRFHRCKANRNQGYGFYCQMPTYGTTARVSFVDCEANTNGSGSDGGYGFICNIAGAIMSGCRARENTQYGFSLARTTLSDSIAEGNAGTTAGIRLVGGCTVSNTVSRFNRGAGFVLTSTVTEPQTLSACKSHGNWGKGYDLITSQGATLTGCGSSLNRGDGYALGTTSVHNHLTGCTAVQNSSTTDDSSSNFIVESNSSFNNLVGNFARQSDKFFSGFAVVDAATTTTTIMVSAWASPTDDDYNGMYLRIVAGTQNGQAVMVSDYNGTTKVVTLESAIAGAPDGTSQIEIVGSVMLTASVQSATATTIVLDESIAPKLDDIFNGSYVEVVSGTGTANTPKLISDYVGSTRTLTVASMSPVLDESSVIKIVCINRPKYGMRIAASNCYYNKVDSNDLWYAGITAYSNVGTSTHAAANRGALSGSATYDPGNLVDGTGVTTTVTCTGAALGNFARAAFSTALQGITLTAWVSAANTVSVRFQNESGGDLDLASGTLSVRVET